MKRVFAILFALVASISTIMAADYIVIRVGKNIAMPVKVNTSNGTYTVSSHEMRTDGNVTVNSAYDANGAQIMVQGSVSGGTNQSTVRYYDLTQTYPSSSSSSYSSSSSSSSSTSVYNSGSGVYNNALRAVDAMMFISGDGYPYLGIEVGYSRFCSYFVRPRLALGESAGFLLYGGLGKEDIFKKEGASEDVYWHVGLGTYFTDEINTIETGFTFGTNPMCNNTIYDADIYSGWGFLMDARYSFTIPDTRWSLYAGAGIGVGWPERGEAKLLLDFQLGLSVKLFDDWW